MTDLTPEDIRAFAEACGLGEIEPCPCTQGLRLKDYALRDEHKAHYEPHLDLNQAVAGLEAFCAKADYRWCEPTYYHRVWRVRIGRCDKHWFGRGKSLAECIVRAVLEAAKAGEGRG